MGGIVTQIKSQMDKKGNMMAFFTLEDFAGSIECLCFADPYRRFGSHLTLDALILVAGSLSTREGERPKLKVATLTPLSETRNGAVLDLHVRLTPEHLQEGTLGQLESLVCRFDRGNGFLYLYYPVGTQTVKIKSNRVRIEARRELVDSLRELLGADSVMCSRG
jgi:DNA polymerase-3 subunit alpha